MRQRLMLFVMVVALFGASAGAIGAQDIDTAFSEEKLRELGYPVVQIHVGPDGVEAPSTLEAGYYLIEFSSEGEYSGYLDFMIPPDGLSEDEATEQALLAAAEDLVQPGWQYAGGTNTFEQGVPVTFAIYLAPGEYQVAASYYLPEQGAEEIMTLVPLTVTEPGAGATPVSATPGAARPVYVQPAVDVTLIMNDDLQYIVDPDGSEDTVPAGPQIWEITNTGTMHSHHVVMAKVPDGTTSEDIVAEFGGLMSGTPPAGDGVMAQMQFVAYAALQSGGYKTWNEFDLEAGTYAVICYIIDPETGMPHVMNGMATVFVVE
jgi:hypothetical protein